MSNPSQIQVTLCSTFLLNNKDFNTILLYVSIGYDIDKQINNYSWFLTILVYIYILRKDLILLYYIIILYY